MKIGDVREQDRRPVTPSFIAARGGPEQVDGLPDWVPPAVRHYLEHVEGGAPIRVLARRAQVHASTVLRQVRQLENRRDDPLVDGALRRLSRRYRGGRGLGAARGRGPAPPDPGFGAADAELLRVLRRMAEPGAVLAVAEGMAVAAVLRETAMAAHRLARVERVLAEAMALRGWIASCDGPGRVARYRITAAGRAALRRLCPLPDPAMPGLAETSVAPCRAVPVEGPLAVLARRRDRRGRPFLSQALVAAGERLREDFELAQIGPRATQDWSRFLTMGCTTARHAGAPPDARARLAEALSDLGPGLGDVALSCCCHLEGLESLERRMGWSARSGKVVLRIALQRLCRHYATRDAPLIG